MDRNKNREMVKDSGNVNVTEGKRSAVARIGDKRRSIEKKRAAVTDYEELFKPDVLIKPGKVDSGCKNSVENKKESKEKLMDDGTKSKAHQKHETEQKIKRNKELIKCERKEKDKQADDLNERNVQKEMEYKFADEMSCENDMRGNDGEEIIGDYRQILNEISSPILSDAVKCETSEQSENGMDEIMTKRNVEPESDTSNDNCGDGTMEYESIDQDNSSIEFPAKAEIVENNDLMEKGICKGKDYKKETKNGGLEDAKQNRKEDGQMETRGEWQSEKIDKREKNSGKHKRDDKEDKELWMSRKGSDVKTLHLKMKGEKQIDFTSDEKINTHFDIEEKFEEAIQKTFLAQEMKDGVLIREDQFRESENENDDMDINKEKNVVKAKKIELEAAGHTASGEKRGRDEKDTEGEDSVPETKDLKEEVGCSAEETGINEQHTSSENKSKEKKKNKEKNSIVGVKREKDQSNDQEKVKRGKEKRNKRENGPSEMNSTDEETKNKTHKKLKIKLSYEVEKNKKRKKMQENDLDENSNEKNVVHLEHKSKTKKNKHKKDIENNARKRKMVGENGEAKKLKTEESVKIKKANEEQKWKWWEEDNYEDGVKWKFLEHKGPYFAPPYEPLPDDVNFFYDGKPMKLSLVTEEVATFYGKMIDHEYTTKNIFQRNFFHDWTEVMNEEEKETITDLTKCDFTQIHKYFFNKNEARKALPKEEKQKLKLEADKIAQEYGFCTLDGHREKIGNFKTEPPGLFRGRGDHPKMGMLKKRIMPHDVIINCSKESVIPVPPERHKWKEVRCDNTVTWLASWTENIQGAIKYIMLNPSSKLKGEKDWQKYEIARRLKGVVATIRRQYMLDFKAREMKTRQRAVALYFIDKLALRAGNEKEEGESADTVGCCSLRVEHIKLHKKLDGQEYVVEFDFLGKDSIRYYNKVPVLKEVYKNLNRFMENKDPGDDLFDRLNTTIVNKHLQDLMDGLTAKVFRTYNASITLQEQLKALTNVDDNVAAKILSYNRANRAVALLCNHQRALPKTYEKSMQTLQAKIDAKKEQLSAAKKELKKAKAELKHKNDEKSKRELEKKKKLRERLEESLMKLEVQATDKEENKQIALGTSKLNYLDPRITVSWCKKFGVPIEKIYNKTQRDKFAWAIDMTDENFEF